MEKIDFSSLDWYSLLPRLGVDASYIENPRKMGPCPIEGAGKTRFRFDNKGGRGTWICNHCGAGDGVRLVALVNQCSDTEAIDLIKGQMSGNYQPINGSKPGSRPVFDKTPEEIAENRTRLKRVWEKSIPIHSPNGLKSPAAMYIQNRIKGIDLQWLSPAVRYSPRLFHFDEDTDQKSFRPGMIWRVTDAASPTKVVTLHRTYIDAKGHKANVSPDQVKKLMASTVQTISGESIKLNTVCSSLIIVTEGVENGLAWVAATQNLIEVYAAVNCNNMAKFKWPPHAKGILIAGDHDAINPKTGIRPGYNAALALKKRAQESGLKVMIKIPPVQSIDWDDLWNSGALEEFAIFKTPTVSEPQALVA